MKSIFSIGLLFLFSIQLLQGQIVSSDCTVPVELQEAYDRDVKGIAIKRMQQFNSPDLDEVIIPDSWQDSIFAGLAAIYNATSLSQRDSVFNLYCVHDNFGTPMVDGIIVGFNETATWTAAWANGETLTGEPTMDDIIQTYHLELESYSSFGFAVLNTGENLNLLALGNLIAANVPGVDYGEPNYIIGLGGRIIYEIIDGIQFFDFIYEWNDCFDGCDNFYTWKYRVGADCEVEFLGSNSGGFFGTEELPEPTNCNISVGTKEHLLPQPVSLFPNPTRDAFEVKVVDPGGLLVELYSGQGQLLHRQSLATSTRLNVDDYSVGLYWVKVVDHDNRYRLLPLVKQ